ncbi:MAG: hypothetical protein SGI74_10705 [Oligoflexia bacterium]|nr:hypothetical protein [Oligoflexia bacterium]
MRANLYFKTIVFGIIFFLSSAAYALVNNSLYLGMGALSHGLNKSSQEANGETNTLGTFYYPIVAKIPFEIGFDWQIAPYAGYSYLLANQSSDGGSKTTYLFLGVPLVYNFNEVFSVEGGLTILWYTIEGQGGLKTSRNSTSTTTYGLPASYQRTRTIALDLGFGCTLADYHIALNTMVESLFSPTRRTYSAMLTFTYQLWEF